LIKYKSSDLPYLTVIWSSSNCIIAAVSDQLINFVLQHNSNFVFLLCIIKQGYDCSPVIYKYNSSNGKLEFLDKIDKSTKKEVDGFSAMRKFRDMDKFAISLNDHNATGSVNDNTPDTIHKNSIKEIRVVSSDLSGAVNKFSTIGLDGQLVVWDVSNYKAY